MTSRVLVPEILDELPASDAAAQKSRADLRRLNALMGHAKLIAKELRALAVKRIADLGGGDGSLMLKVARGLQTRDVELTIIDQQNTVTSKTRDAFKELGWTVSVECADVFKALQVPREFEAITANLFLHHFQAERLRELLELAAQSTRLFVACEPRRSQLALTASRCVGLIGCNHVTRHDAVASVRAGFRGSELSAVWPAGWHIEERSAGLFSHLFVARKS
jgi:2-polyprenyl-3-methyl-5-hydroxy-6-metoxy-1,4-benzoquinol methylase